MAPLAPAIREPAQLTYERDELGFVPTKVAGLAEGGSCVVALHSDVVERVRKHAYADYHTLSFALGGGELYRLGKDGRLIEFLHPGTLAIQPADAESVWQSEGRAHWLQCYLSTALVTECALSMQADRAGEAKLARGRAVDHPEIVRLLYACAASVASSWQPAPLEMDAWSTALVTLLVSRYSRHPVPRLRVDTEKLPASKLAAAFDYIDSHLGPGLTASSVAAALGVSRYHFTRAFAGATGETPYAYIQRRRLRMAQARVVASDAALTEIALDLGYASQAHMTSDFSAQLKVSPGDVRALALGRRVPRPRRLGRTLAS